MNLESNYFSHQFFMPINTNTPSLQLLSEKQHIFLILENLTIDFQDPYINPNGKKFKASLEKLGSDEDQSNLLI